MRFIFQIIRFGTDHYPEKTARGLRVLNATTLCGASFVFGFALYDAAASLWTLVVINLLTALFLATIPLWHRAGPLVAPLVYVAGTYTAIFVICSLLGTDSGMQAQYLAIAAGTVLVLGAERIFLLVIIGVVAIALVVALEVLVPGDTGLLTQRQMLENFIGCTVGTAFILFAIVYYAVREASRAEEAAEREYQRSEGLLANILPAAIANRLKYSTETIADRYDEASVLFADMAGFTAMASRTSPLQLVRLLNNVFTDFDHLVDKHGLEKIKTTGDGYMVVSGVPTQRADHAKALANFAIEMIEIAARYGNSVPIRIGMASGPLVAGVVGRRKFFYDVWGDTVNVASRMESSGLPGRIQVSVEAFERLRDEFDFEPGAASEIKGKGLMTTWLLLGRRSEAISVTLP
ncbi:MAG: adenylate/guanylate cyclase domain-containing protein [Hyphomicrobium sp.]